MLGLRATAAVHGEERQQAVIRRVYQQVSTRPDSFCNYLEGSVPEWGEGTKLIYRHYATLYFVFAGEFRSIARRDGRPRPPPPRVLMPFRSFPSSSPRRVRRARAVDAQESDLGILDLIQVFVEALDKRFENVCELDLIFHSDKVHYILDEIVMGGMVLETNIHAILQALADQETMHADSLKRAGHGGGPRESVDAVANKLGAGRRW